MRYDQAKIPLRAAIALADDGPDVDAVDATLELMGLIARAAGQTSGGNGRQEKKGPATRNFRSVFGSFVRSEADAAVSRVKVDDPAMREAVRCEAAAAAMLSDAEVPGAGRLAGAVSLSGAQDRAKLMTGMREAVELDRGVSAWSGKRLPVAEMERRRRELDPTAVYAASKLIADPEGSPASVAVRGWMNDPAADVLVKAKARRGGDMER